MICVCIDVAIQLNNRLHDYSYIFLHDRAGTFASLYCAYALMTYSNRSMRLITQFNSIKIFMHLLPAILLLPTTLTLCPYMIICSIEYAGVDYLKWLLLECDFIHVNKHQGRIQEFSKGGSCTTKY